MESWEKRKKIIKDAVIFFLFLQVSHSDCQFVMKANSPTTFTFHLYLLLLYFSLSFSFYYLLKQKTFGWAGKHD